MHKLPEPGKFFTMKILNHHQISQKIKRLSIEILEQNYLETEIIFAGVNKNGWKFAQLLANEARKRTEIPIHLTNIRLNPADPLSEDIVIDRPLASIAGKTIILVDDVSNTGRTLFYAFKPLLAALPAKIQVAVLVDRTHKAFPVQVDFCGLSLATTLKEHIEVSLADDGHYEAALH